MILTGPTASGKTALAIDLAEMFDAEIISADSRQIYRGMPIGTAAPTDEELARVRHHLVGTVDPFERYSAARFVRDAMDAIAGIAARGKRAIVAGGTGFYVRALSGDIALSAVADADVRDRIAAEVRLHDGAFLAEWLHAIAPERARALGNGDPYRIARALEIALAARSDRVASADETSLATLRDGSIAYAKTYLDIDDEALQAAIESRTDAMLDAGLIDEAERIGADAVAANAVGYREALAYRAGWITRAELRTLLVRNTRRYAKRQRTWFRTEPDLRRLPPERAAWFAFARTLPGWS